MSRKCIFGLRVGNIMTNLHYPRVSGIGRAASSSSINRRSCGDESCMTIHHYHLSVNLSMSSFNGSPPSLLLNNLHYPRVSGIGRAASSLSINRRSCGDESCMTIHHYHLSVNLSMSSFNGSPLSLLLNNLHYPRVSGIGRAASSSSISRRSCGDESCMTIPHYHLSVNLSMSSFNGSPPSLLLNNLHYPQVSGIGRAASSLSISCRSCGDESCMTILYHLSVNLSMSSFNGSPLSLLLNNLHYPRVSGIGRAASSSSISRRSCGDESCMTIHHYHLSVNLSMSSFNGSPPSLLLNNLHYPRVSGIGRAASSLSINRRSCGDESCMTIHHYHLSVNLSMSSFNGSPLSLLLNNLHYPRVSGIEMVASSSSISRRSCGDESCMTIHLYHLSVNLSMSSFNGSPPSLLLNNLHYPQVSGIGRAASSLSISCRSCSDESCMTILYHLSVNLSMSSFNGSPLSLLLNNLHYPRVSGTGRAASSSSISRRSCGDESCMTIPHYHLSVNLSMSSFNGSPPSLLLNNLHYPQVSGIGRAASSLSISCRSCGDESCMTILYHLSVNLSMSSFNGSPLSLLLNNLHYPRVSGIGRAASSSSISRRSCGDESCMTIHHYHLSVNLSMSSFNGSPLSLLLNNLHYPHVSGIGRAASSSSISRRSCGDESCMTIHHYHNSVNLSMSSFNGSPPSLLLNNLHYPQVSGIGRAASSLSISCRSCGDESCMTILYHLSVNLSMSSFNGSPLSLLLNNLHYPRISGIGRAASSSSISRRSCGDESCMTIHHYHLSVNLSMSSFNGSPPSLLLNNLHYPQVSGIGRAASSLSISCRSCGDESCMTILYHLSVNLSMSSFNGSPLSLLLNNLHYPRSLELEGRPLLQVSAVDPVAMSHA